MCPLVWRRRGAWSGAKLIEMVNVSAGMRWARCVERCKVNRNGECVRWYGGGEVCGAVQS